jgi:hypothetical protein
MLQEYNKSPISLREGKVFIDGLEVMDSVTCTINFTPETWSGKQLGEQSNSSRWLGYAITGSITRRRSTPWLKETLQKYIKSKRTPEFKIQGLMNDENSDYFADHGSNTVTAVGCVLTGGLNLTNLDSAGQVVDDVINFNAKNVV